MYDRCRDKDETTSSGYRGPVWGVYYFIFPNWAPALSGLGSAVFSRGGEGGRGV